MGRRTIPINLLPLRRAPRSLPGETAATEVIELPEDERDVIAALNSVRDDEAANAELNAQLADTQRISGLRAAMAEVAPVELLVNDQERSADSTDFELNDRLKRIAERRTAIMLLAAGGRFVLSIGSNENESWLLAMQTDADDVLVQAGWRRDSAWGYLDSFMSCDIVRDV